MPFKIQRYVHMEIFLFLRINLKSYGTKLTIFPTLVDLYLLNKRAGPDSMQLPTAHTCFNTLIAPDYGDDYEKLSDRLGRAVIECEGFGLQ